MDSDSWFFFYTALFLNIQDGHHRLIYREVSNIRRTLVGNKIIDH